MVQDAADGHGLNDLPLCQVPPRNFEAMVVYPPTPLEIRRHVKLKRCIDSAKQKEKHMCEYVRICMYIHTHIDIHSAFMAGQDSRAGQMQPSGKGTGESWAAGCPGQGGKAASIQGRAGGGWPASACWVAATYLHYADIEGDPFIKCILD